MATTHKTRATAIKTGSSYSVNSLSIDTLRATLNTKKDILNFFSQGETLAINMSITQTRLATMLNSIPAFLSKLFLPLIMVFVLGTASTAILKADGQDEEGYIHKPKLVLWEEYYREWLDIEHQKMYGRPWDPDNPGDPLFFFNPDSVMVDVNWGECDWTYLPYVGAIPPVPDLPFWFKRVQYVTFVYNIIPRPEIYEDNRLIKYTIDDILPKYKETIEGFKELEKIFGTFHFEDRWTMYPDTTEYIPGEQAHSPRALSIVFDNYIFDSHYGYKLDFLESKYGLIDVAKALGKIKFVSQPSIDHNLGGNNPIFHTGIDYDKQTNVLPLFVSPMITSDNITLSLPEVLTIFPKSIQIVNSIGNTVKLLYTGIDTQQIIDVSNLPAGRYFVRIDNYVGSFIVR